MSIATSPTPQVKHNGLVLQVVVAETDNNRSGLALGEIVTLRVHSLKATLPVVLRLNHVLFLLDSDAELLPIFKVCTV
jgi:hypothetical protein